MSWTLRPYQKNFTKKLSRSLYENKSVIGCAPTGSGKSKMMASIALAAIVAKKESEDGKAVLIITESIKIYSQLQNELDVTDINAGVKHVDIKRGRVYLAMCQTLTRRKHLIDEFAELGFDLLVMYDEAHIGTGTKLLSNFSGKTFLIGWTATPDYRAAKHLPTLYNDCVQACQVDELIQEGFLCTYRHIARDKANLDILEIRGGDYTEDSNEKAFSTDEVYDGLLEDLEKFPFKKAMVFTASIKQCEETYMRLLENGVKATRYHSELKNADYELAKFTELDMCNVCVSVSSLTKGFDFPAIDLVCLLRKTKSLPLYLQMIGRASRPVKDAEGNVLKSEFIVLDYGSHWKTLGLYWDDRDWVSMWQPPPTKKKKQDGGGIATVKACEGCDELIAVQVRKCPKCGYEYPEIEKELAIGESIEITKSYTDLVGKRVSELEPPELAVYAKIKNKKAHAVRVAMAKEQTSPGFVKQFGEQMGFKREWHYMILREIRDNPVKDFYDTRLK